jgi:hypothetical protein
MERLQKWTKCMMAVEFNSTTVYATSETEDTATIKFDNLKTDSPITGFSVQFKKDEIQHLVRLLQDFQEKCY